MYLKKVTCYSWLYSLVYFFFILVRSACYSVGVYVFNSEGFYLFNVECVFVCNGQGVFARVDCTYIYIH